MTYRGRSFLRTRSLGVVTAAALVTSSGLAWANVATAQPPPSSLQATSQPDTSLDSTSTSSWGATVTVSTQSQLTKAVDAAKPGTTIRLNSGTYSGGLLIRTSGTPQQRIVIEPAGNGPVKLTANLSTPPCNASSPDGDRTVRFADGASFWTLKGLTIQGGVNVSGGNHHPAHLWFAALIRSGAWQARRAVPGRGVNDPVAAHKAIAYVANKVGKTLRPADGIRIVNDVITRKGIHVTMGRYGVISHTSISDIACGTGGGIWFGTYSDGWKITHNNLSRIAKSTLSHYMQEGIRIDGASNYNLIQDNVVHDLPTIGRAFTTDSDASYNTFLGNTARNLSIGYSDEKSGWQNTWTDNVAAEYRDAGFVFRAKDNDLRHPSLESSSYRAIVTCNTASGSRDLQIGASAQSRFSSNSFHTVELGKYLKQYWGAEGNTWNGSKQAPASKVNPSSKGC